MGEEAIASALAKLQESVRQSLVEAKRADQDVRILLVSKTIAAGRILEAFVAGVREFGENKVQELLSKKESLPSEIKWHLIGSLQTNKVKHIIGQTELIHSLDRPELVDALEKQAAKHGIKSVDCLIQVNSSGEASKSGLAPEAVPGFVEQLKLDSPVKVKGLMTIGPFTEDKSRIRQCFRRVKELRDQLMKDYPAHDWGILSMGMSGDYRIAIEEGSNLIRVGTVVFGARPKKVQN